uniref:Uncharacterized protein n=1 Tax=Solanum lycopersicum TaxID=4081 RepID=A0A494G9Y6_SOLLC
GGAGAVGQRRGAGAADHRGAGRAGPAGGNGAGGDGGTARNEARDVVVDHHAGGAVGAVVGDRQRVGHRGLAGAQYVVRRARAVGLLGDAQVGALVCGACTGAVAVVPGFRIGVDAVAGQRLQRAVRTTRTRRIVQRTGRTCAADDLQLRRVGVHRQRQRARVEVAGDALARRRHRIGSVDAAGPWASEGKEFLARRQFIHHLHLAGGRARTEVAHDDGRGHAAVGIAADAVPHGDQLRRLGLGQRQVGAVGEHGERCRAAVVVGAVA